MPQTFIYKLLINMIKPRHIKHLDSAEESDDNKKATH